MLVFPDMKMEKEPVQQSRVIRILKKEREKIYIRMCMTV